jgi:hypothetical protein
MEPVVFGLYDVLVIWSKESMSKDHQREIVERLRIQGIMNRIVFMYNFNLVVFKVKRMFLSWNTN